MCAAHPSAHTGEGHIVGESPRVLKSGRHQCGRTVATMNVGPESKPVWNPQGPWPMRGGVLHMQASHSEKV